MLADAGVERRVRAGQSVLEFVARRIARSLAGQVHYDDLVALGYPALYRAAGDWEPSRGATFAAFAAMKIRWAIIDGVRRETHGRAVKARALALEASERFGAAALSMGDAPAAEPLPDEDAQGELRALLEGHAAALALGIVSAVGDMAEVLDEGETPEEQLSRLQFAAVVRRKVAVLPVRERVLLERHYYAGEDFDGIAGELGISKSWASRLHAQAVRRLAEAFRDEG